MVRKQNDEGKKRDGRGGEYKDGEKERRPRKMERQEGAKQKLTRDEVFGIVGEGAIPHVFSMTI